MSGTFKGFTDKDIENLRSPKKEVTKTTIKKATMKTKSIPHPVTLKKMTGDPKFEIIDHKARLSQPPVDETAIESLAAIENIHKVEANDLSNNVLNVDLKNTHNETEFEEVILSPNYNVGEVEKPINLEAFQQQQKLFEEQNRKRREMLSKALDDRSKQTAEEVSRLNNIKKELQTLDLQLSDDVSILRKKIDHASLIYSEAEKNYFRIEKEFLNAKLKMQKEKENKELLTEHLCTLIAHNEARKAKKLESLMDQLAYNTVEGNHGVCEQTGKMLEMEDGKVIIRED